MAEDNKQFVKYIPVKDLVLWSENPRDPISAHNGNVDVILRALEDSEHRWKLCTLAKQMGAHYDLSELPTVVYKKGRPIVYDGNRRVILAMLELGVYSDLPIPKIRLPECPELMPCCVTSEKVALENVWRKHSSTGSWDQLSRDIFLHKYMKQDKSVLMQLDEILKGRVSVTSYLNKRFVRDEVLTNTRLKCIGIKIEDGQIASRHTPKNTKLLLESVFDLIGSNKVSTRIARKTPLNELIDPKLKDIVDADSIAPYRQVELDANEVLYLNNPVSTEQKKLPRRTNKVLMPLFGEKLSLRRGAPADLYRDILDMYSFFYKYKNKLSNQFPALIGMALRLECELIAKCLPTNDIAYPIKDKFDIIKARLSQDQRTFLAQNTVTKENVVSLLHTYAHNYTGSCNLQQIIAVSLIVGGLLKIYFGKEYNNE